MIHEREERISHEPASTAAIRQDSAAPHFVGDLPSGRRGGGQRNPMFDALTERPGEWAEYWGDVDNVYGVARKVKRDGFRFEGAVRLGKPYIRAVRDGD